MDIKEWSRRSGRVYMGRTAVDPRTILVGGRTRMAPNIGYYTALAQSLLALGEQREAAYQQELANHIQTIGLLGALKKGELPDGTPVTLDDVIVSDDGWQLVPPPPNQGVSPDPAPVTSLASVRAQKPTKKAKVE